MKRITKHTEITLVNPWSGARSVTMTWSAIQRWAYDSVHPIDRDAWLRAARAAMLQGDGATLGKMIIGS